MILLTTNNDKAGGPARDRDLNSRRIIALRGFLHKKEGNAKPFRMTSLSNPPSQPLWNDIVHKKVGGEGGIREISFLRAPNGPSQ